MKKSACVLAGDVGGTKTILGLYVPGRIRPKARVTATFASADSGSLELIIEQMLKRYPAKIKSACFGIAGPVIKGVGRTTNLPWVISEKKLQNRFGWPMVHLINDLEATARAVPLLQHREVRALNNARVRKDRNIGLVAPGTGLGQALMMFSNGRYHPLASEGGHASFAPSDESEIELWQYLHMRFGHVSAERVLSGQGLVNIYNWLITLGTYDEIPAIRKAMQEQDPARVISEHAVQANDPLCKAALQRFCRIFGSVAGNLALAGMTTGGVFLGGGIPAKIFPVLEKSEFMSAFTAKGRFEVFMKKIAVRVILNEKASLLGAAYCALSQ